MEVFNSVHQQTGDEGRAAASAWSAVKKMWIEKNEKQRYTLGIVYEPNVEDTQGDYSTADEIEKAAWGFMKKLQDDAYLKIANFALRKTGVLSDDEAIEKRGLNVMHVNTPFDDAVGTVVESFIAPCDMQVGEQTVTKGTWLMGVVWDEDIFTKVESGDFTGYSMEGRGRRVDE